MTAIFATIGALFGYMVGATQNDALLFKNDSAIRKTEASDQWNFYQAKSGKQNLADLGAVLASGGDAARFKSEAERYGKEKQEIMAKAQEPEKPTTHPEPRSQASGDLHPRRPPGVARHPRYVRDGACDGAHREGAGSHGEAHGHRRGHQHFF